MALIPFALALVVMIPLASRLRIHPFAAILGMSLVLGAVSGVPLARVPEVIGAGFSGIFSEIGIVVIFGLLIGTIVETSGAAAVIADAIVRLVGKGSPTLAFALMGWVCGTAVNCDSGFATLNPVRKAAVRHAGAGGIQTAVGLSGGLYISHALVPLTAAPLAAAGILGLGGHLPLVMALAVAASVPALAGACLYAAFIGRNRRTREDIRIAGREPVRSAAHSYGGKARRRGGIPGGLFAVSPILAPFLLMSLGSIAAATEWEGPGRDAVAFLGAPVMAMAAGLLFAVALLVRSGRMRDFNPITESALKSSGPILCVMGAGGVLGYVIEHSGLALSVLENTTAAGSVGTPGLLLPFLVAALLKTAQGSSAVAMTVTAALVAPMMSAPVSDSAVAAALTFLAIGAGSMVASHANDPYFWMVSKLSGMSVRQGYATHTVMTLIAGLGCMAGALAISLFIR